MLCMYTVKNFKSIKDEITLDMQAATLSEHTDKIIRTSDGEDYLPVTVIYGPNGGGKSNVLEALLIMCNKIMKPIYAIKDNLENADNKVGKLIVEPFEFSQITKNEPTKFEVYFRTKKYEYKYSIHIKKESVIYESLDKRSLETGRPSGVFSRDKEGIVLKGSLKKLAVNKDISTSLPFLSYLGITNGNNAIVKDVINWFENGIYFLNYGNPIQELRMAISNSKKFKDLVVNMMQECGIDIYDYRIEKKESGMEIFIKHKIGDHIYEIPFIEESSGTQKLFGMMPVFADSLTSGKTLVVDEMDAKIHPVLLKHIIEMFTDMKINKKGAQLIFTSHDLSTMNNEVFRRDEIWFVAKGYEENSVLYSLSDFKDDEGKTVRKDEAYGKRYLEGRYGADPCLKKIIEWSVIRWSQIAPGTKVYELVESLVKYFPEEIKKEFINEDEKEKEKIVD